MIVSIESGWCREVTLTVPGVGHVTCRVRRWLRWPPGFDDGQCRSCELYEWQLSRTRPYVEVCGITTGEADNHVWWWPPRASLPPPIFGRFSVEDIHNVG